MTYQELKQLIDAFRAETQPDSITPDTLGQLLDKIAQFSEDKDPESKIDEGLQDIADALTDALEDINEGKTTAESVIASAKTEALEEITAATAAVEEDKEEALEEIEEAKDDTIATIQGLDVTQTVEKLRVAAIEARNDINPVNILTSWDIATSNNPANPYLFFKKGDDKFVMYGSSLYKNGTRIVRYSRYGSTNFSKSNYDWYDRENDDIYNITWTSNALILVRNHAQQTTNVGGNPYMQYTAFANTITDANYNGAIRTCQFGNLRYGVSYKGGTTVSIFTADSDGLTAVCSLSIAHKSSFLGDIYVDDTGIYFITINSDIVSLYKLNDERTAATKIADTFIRTTAYPTYPACNLFRYNGNFYAVGGTEILPLIPNDVFNKEDLHTFDMMQLSAYAKSMVQAGQKYFNTFIQLYDDGNANIIYQHTNSTRSDVYTSNLVDVLNVNLNAVFSVIDGNFTNIENVQKVSDIGLWKSAYVNYTGQIQLYTTGTGTGIKRRYLDFGEKDKMLCTKTHPNAEKMLWRNVARGLCKHMSYVFIAGTKQNAFASATFRIPSVQWVNNKIYVGASARMESQSDESVAKTVMAVSDDNGINFRNFHVAMTSGTHNKCSDGMIAVDTSTAHAGRIWSFGTWWDGSDSHLHTDIGVMYNYSDDGGITWSENAEIDSACASNFETLGIVGTFLHVRTAASSAINYNGKLIVPLEVYYQDSQNSNIHNAFGLYVTSDGTNWTLQNVKDVSVTSSNDFPEVSICIYDNKLYATARSYTGRKFYKLDSLSGNWDIISSATEPDTHSKGLQCGFGCLNGVFILSTPTTDYRTMHNIYATRDFVTWKKIYQYDSISSNIAANLCGYSQLIISERGLKVALENKYEDIVLYDLDYLIPVIMGT